MPNLPIDEADVLDLIRKLGHDPTRVASVTITPTTVDVVYEHVVTRSKTRSDLPRTARKPSPSGGN
jgi:hypothetical protein